MYALQHAGAVTANARELVDRARAFFDREIVLIPNGISVEHFKPVEKNPALARTFGIRSSEVPVIGFAGELREKKGLKSLINAYAQVNARTPATLLIVGVVRAGEDQEVVDEFRLSHPHSQLIITGYISPKDLPVYYALIDIFVHPSVRDGMPNALLEAMAAGLPVVATLVEGVAEVLGPRSDEQGVLPGMAPGCEEKLLSLAASASKRSSLGRANQDRVSQEFLLASAMQAYEQIYITLMKS